MPDTVPEPHAPPSAPADVPPVRIVEAALFSAGKPLDETEIAENTGLRREAAKAALRELAEEYARRDSALEVARAGSKWAMQVRAAYAPSTVRLAPMEIPIRLLKTLALVAYHQPLLQSDLVDMVGAKAYEHVHDLVERGLVKRRLDGRSFLLSTSELFPEYFGIPASDREQIKRYLAEKVGLPLPLATDGKGNALLPLEEPPAAAPPDLPAGPPGAE